MRHRFHALCPYFAMFPESFAGRWIQDLSRPGDIVLDPFCGRGTAPFEALLRGRSAVGCDINPVAYCVSRAKMNAPPAAVVRGRLTKLRNGFKLQKWEPSAAGLPEFFRYAFSPLTLSGLLYLRACLRWERSDVDCMIAALVLGSLHGEITKSPSYLSNQMPRTISTKPDYSVRFWSRRGLAPPHRDVFALLENRLAFRYESAPPGGRGLVFHADFRDLPFLMQAKENKADLVITSPPYLDTTNFEEDQWLRGWFLGGPACPRKTARSRDDRCRSSGRYWRLIADTWRVLGRVVRPGGHVVVRIGGKRLDPEGIVAGLRSTATFSRRKVELLSWEVSELRGKQTNAFRPGAEGCAEEVDACFWIG